MSPLKMKMDKEPRDTCTGMFPMPDSPPPKRGGGEKLMHAQKSLLKIHW